jgi:hypothetical protein
MNSEETVFSKATGKGGGIGSLVEQSLTALISDIDLSH